MPITLYYHLFPGSSLSKIISLHFEQLIAQASFDHIMIEAYNLSYNDIKILQPFYEKLANKIPTTLNLNTPSHDVNEFTTLDTLQKKLSQHNKMDWIAFAHTKGVTHEKNSHVIKKSQFLMRNINFLAKTIKNNAAFAEFYNTAGSDLAWANFEAFGPPQLHFCGMFWLARVDYLLTLPQISREALLNRSARFKAEGWIGLSPHMNPFNTFCPHRYHYDQHMDYINPDNIEKEALSFLTKQEDWKKTQDYFNATLLHYEQKIDSIIKRIYPYTFNIRRNFLQYFKSYILRSKLLASFLYRSGIGRSKFELYTLYVPSQLELCRYLHL